MTLEQKIYLTTLYDIYYQLCTPKQQEIFELYIDYDYSITEIAIQKEVSPANISKIISKTSKKILDYEEKLNIYKNYQFNIKLLTDNNINENIISKLKK